MSRRDRRTPQACRMMRDQALADPRVNRHSRGDAQGVDITIQRECETVSGDTNKRGRRVSYATGHTLRTPAGARQWQQQQQGSSGIIVGESEYSPTGEHNDAGGNESLEGQRRFIVRRNGASRCRGWPAGTPDTTGRERGEARKRSTRRSCARTEWREDGRQGRERSTSDTRIPGRPRHRAWASSRPTRVHANLRTDRTSPAREGQPGRDETGTGYIRVRPHGGQLGAGGQTGVLTQYNALVT
mmetsp:Transcript_29965/g.61661  ORF Transcript_29965/g.61661 Transcript_29965/m.61661 type:complete len:243 (+) Transcript_29965:270-998(+)